MKRSSNRSVVTRLRALLLTTGLVLAGVVGVASPASADTGGYPYASYYGPGTNPTGSFWTDSSGNDTSPYGYNYRNCTDYVAWKLQSLGVTDAKTRGLGNGGEWADNAQGRAGVSVSTAPSVNSVGVKVSTTGDPFGHVAFVETVNSNGTLTVSEYNWVVNGTPDGAFHRRTATAASMGLTKFINFGVPSGGGTPLPVRSDIRNGGFNNGTSYWARTGTANFTTYGPTGSYEGDGYGATNAAAAGDSIRQDVSLNSTAGHSYCVNAWVRTMGGGSGGAGSLAVFLLGSTPAESSSKVFDNLTSDWSPIESCVTATSSHTMLRVQVYPVAGGPTLGVDAVDMRESLINNAGFNGSSAGWVRTGTANFSLYGSGQYEGSGYAATNGAAAGDSIRQDVSRTINSGDSYCVEAQVRSNTSGATASGSMVIYLLNSTATESSSYQFTGIGTDWTPIKTCVAATGAHTSVRVQFYPAPGAPTIGIDAVSSHYMLSRNGGFNNGTWLWSATGTANFVTYGPTGSYEGDGYAATNGAAAGDSIRQDVSRPIDAGDMYCVTARVRTMGGGSGGAGSLVIYMLNSTGTESSSKVFAGLPGTWTPIKTCVTATGDHTVLRIQIYPAAGGPTIGVDAVDMG